ncbi:MarR family winged helix-turn-helix transcriptional regulator [Acidaminobacter hydrogenoformans]|uniref:Transcriptional regulator, MarR family n=1 Tax=Acidaminobacter hydrogenoformans DSM 2784 TaxID=1120920 RepID=A0A1G5RT85_9FIRM|nr:MarR family transcriptional regulator [Acidaminobacter hydrogenoformans]SCZ77335.1 transcriptional regulator, MarR family [Acidaminobacter hydrogenoformans DSM 2784]
MEQGYDHLMGFNLIEIARKIQVAVSKRMEPLGITFAQYRVVSRLWLEEEMTQKALGDVLTLTAATLTPMLQLMERKGWIERTTDERDTRSKKIRLTAIGTEIRRQAFEVVLAYEQEELRVLPEEEVQLMLKWLRLYNAHLTGD